MDDALEAAVREVERHRGRDRVGSARRRCTRSRAPTDLVRDEPELAARLGLDGASAGSADRRGPGGPHDRRADPRPAGRRSTGRPRCVGAVLVLETVALPDDVEDEAPATDAGAWAVQHPDRQEARVVVGVLRDGGRAAALRWRSHDNDDDVITGPDLAPALADALAQSLR